MRLLTRVVPISMARPTSEMSRTPKSKFSILPIGSRIVASNWNVDDGKGGPRPEWKWIYFQIGRISRDWLDFVTENCGSSFKAGHDFSAAV